MQTITMNPIIRLLGIGQAAGLDLLNSAAGTYHEYEYELVQKERDEVINQYWIDGEVKSKYDDQKHLVIVKYIPGKKLFVYMKDRVKPETFDLSLSILSDDEQIDLITNSLYFPQQTNEPGNATWTAPMFVDFKLDEDQRVGINAQKNNHQITELVGYVIDQVNGKDRGRFLSRHEMAVKFHVNGSSLFLRLEYKHAVSSLCFTTENQPFQIPMDKVMEDELYSCVDKLLKENLL
jgi:hypothetical protein